MATSGEARFGKDPSIVGRRTKRTLKIAFGTNSPKHDMSTYDFGLVALLVKPYAKATR